MSRSIFKLVVMILKMAEVYGIFEVISSSFQGNSFTDSDSWIVSGAEPQITNCMDNRLFGGQNAFGYGVSASKIFSLPPHYKLNLKMQFWKIDSFDNEFAYIYVDQVLVWQQQFQYQDGTQICGTEADWKEQPVDLDLIINHSGSTAIVVITSTLDDWADNESWGFKDFVLAIEQCPQGCLVCQEGETAMQCSFWISFSKSWEQLNIDELTQDGWDVSSGTAEATQCGAVSLFGGQAKTGNETTISKSLTNIPNHTKLKIRFLFVVLDSWDDEFARLKVDNVLVWERQFNYYEGYYYSLCNEQPEIWNTQLFFRVDIILDHTRDQVELEFTTTLDDILTDESFGLRDLSIFYYILCPQNCAWCTEESCLKCDDGYYNSGIEDKWCQKCHSSCQECEGTTNQDCTYCGDPNITNKQLVDGQCQCIARNIQVVLPDKTVKCLPCHQRCEKCYKPKDDTINQYCTMCIAGQNRQVSDDLKCICKSGYGEDGISDLCVQCHYSCENCKGSLSTDCTSCSSLHNRHLTLNNLCSCNKAYVEFGIQNPICQFICDHTCADCDISGIDQCTSCPSTRQPDRVGSTFKCLCKDTHYFSDGFQLECQQCHSTCKTCNGIYDNNCLTCDTTYRQLVMFKCICPYGYYDVGQMQCSPCHYTCMTCFGPLANNCISCATTNNRFVKANQCLCNDQYIEITIGDPMCHKCSYRCNNCILTTETCISCPPLSNRELGTNQSCACPLKSYDQPNNPICITCHQTCLTCNGSLSNQCLTCNTQINRILNDLFECLCKTNYYDSGQLECQQCSPYCLNCNTTPDNCLSCKTDRYLQGNTCLCQNKLSGALISTYQNLSNPICQNCHYSCLNCNGSTSNKCTTCLDSENRYLQNFSCLCAPHYFDVGKPKCLQCNYSCETCAILDTACLTCYPSSFRTLNNQKCICQNGYFDDGVNSICSKCHYSCFKCSSFSTKCDSCGLTSNREFNNLLFSCNCFNNYYDSGIEICQKCHYSCSTCNSFGSQSCKSCLDKTISFRVINGNICQCLFGYYDDGNSTNCKKCSIFCQTCQNAADYCTSCTSTRHLETNKCICDTGYFDQMLELCSKCDSNCVNCKLSPKNCIECDSTLLKVFDNKTQTCICMNGTTDINGVCQFCDITCLTCINTISNCSSCKALKLLINTKCQCIEGTYETGVDKECQLCNSTCQTCINKENYCTSCSTDKYRIFKTGNICICQDGYYEDLVTFVCKQCDFSCLTCQITSKNCQSCDSKMNLSLDLQNKCICSSGFFLNSTSRICEACNITCKECKNLTQCNECEPITRHLDSENLQCLCKDGYYEVNQRKCSLCNITCKTCINQATKCKTCEAIYYRILNNSNACICLDGYYDVGIEMCLLCNKLCKTCQISSTKCYSCYEIEQFRYLSSNQCICKSGYYDNGFPLCEKCSNSCLTCSGKKDYCTSCDINQNRVDLSAIKKCPCSTGFFSDENEVCQKCSLKCSSCSLYKDSCLSCSISKTSNRLSISKNCNCKEGYYDDDLQLDCQNCSVRCKLCSQSSTNCQICSINLRENPPVCNCKAGFYENQSFNCEVCENQCNTCEKTSSNCLTCKEGRYTQKCLCEDGYFEGGQPLCLQCSFQCKTCSLSSLNCLICKGDRQIIPSCSCPDGFYDDFKNDSCQVCDRLCKTCNIDGCLSCIGNRVLTSEMACEEPPHSVIHTETPWCSTCNVAVIDARFSDDLLSISVKFDFPLNPSFFTSQFQDNICFQILDEQTYLKLGKSPNCFLDHNDSMILIIEVGQQVSIIPGDQIIFYGQYFGHLNCVQKIDIFILNQVKIPINPVSPKIFYDLPTYFLNPCDDNTIPIKSIIFDGLRQLIGIRWTFSVDGQNGNGNLESFVNSLTNLQNLELSIPLQTLPKQSNITFFVEFQNFVQQKSIQLIQVQTHSGQFPTIRWISKPYYYAFETIVLQFQIKKKDCSETTTIPQIDNSQYQVSLVEVYRNESNSRPSRVKYSEITNQNSFNVTIQNYTLTSRVAYVFSQNTFDALLNFSLTRNITLEINAGGIFCQFNGTKKIQNYRKDSNILISCRDLDTQYGWNEDPSISLNITCVDLTMNSLCRDLNKQLIKINKTQSIQTISKQTIPPYTIQSWQVTAQKKQYKYTFKQNIVYLDNDFKLLDITYNKGYIMRSINNYENLKFTIQIPFEDRQYLLEYQVAIIYNFQLIKILKSSYFQYHFRIFDYHTKFDKGKQINLKFLAQFTNEIIPSQEDLQLTVNLPPTCIVQIQSETIVALQPFKIITQCDFSNASPFMYQLRYFINNQDYLDFMDRTSDYSLLLNGYQTSNTFEGFFPFSQAHILIQVIDSRGSYSNIVKQINITQAQFKCSDININKLPYKQQIAMLIEILLNHQQLKYCNSISKQLYSNIKSNLGAEDLNDQFLVYQVVKLYKRFILNEKVTKSNNRLMTMDYQERCFQNSTKSFYIQNSTFNNTLTDTATGLISELQQIKLVSKKLIQKQTQFNSELNQDDIFYDEKLFQKKESVAQSLPILLLMIDDIFVKISTVFIQSDEDSKQIIYIAEELIRLIENIAFQFNDQIEVNGPTFTVNGQILNFQISKQTKDNFNNQFNIDKDLLDGLIDFVQKQQISLNYNYYILQQNISSKLSQFLNTSNLLIEQNFLRKTNLKNHLYDNRFIEYQNIEQKYIVDIAQYQYCQEEVPEQLLNYYYCVEINSFGEYFLCDLQVEEIDNITVSISCKCLQFGDIFLVRYTNNSYEEQTIKQQNLDDKMEDFDLKINEQPILLFHGIFIIFSFFLYIELNCIETKVAYNFINHGIILESTNDDIPTLGKQKLLFYPGSFAIYKMIFKHLHEIISIFYIESFIVTKSFRFLQLSIKISLLIPLSFLEILYIQKVAILAALFVNCVFYLLIRIICKIFQSFYRFRGKLSKFIVGVYLIIHIVCYIFFIILLRKYKGDYHQLNLDISLILTLSIFLQFVILDPVMIFFRIIITKYVTVQIRNIILNPINQLIYFFIENEKLDELLQQYVIM